MAPPRSPIPTPRLRDRQREATRRDLAYAAFELASGRGLSNVRVPDIALAAGVSTRTFNNYFASKEEAIVWPATRRAAEVSRALLNRPPAEPLGEALVAAFTSLYRAPQADGLPPHWLRGFRALVAAEPSLRGEYLKASDETERALAEAIGQRIDVDADQLRPQVLAAVIVAAERTAVMHWIRRPQAREPLVEVVRAALLAAVAGVSQAP